MAQQLRVQYVQYYTDGSAARKVETPAIQTAPKKVRTRKQKRIVIPVDPVSVLGILMAAVMLVLMVVGYARLQNAQQEVQVMEQYVSTLRRENASLQEEYMNGFDIDEVERTALGLGMIPQEQAQRIPIRVSVPQEEVQPGAWEGLVTFLAGLFA